MLIAEDLLLLITDNASGKPVVGSTELENGLAGAVLLELALAGRVDVEEGRGPFRANRLLVVDPAPTGDQVLDAGLRSIAAKPGRKPESVLGGLRKGLRPRLYQRLATQGILRAQEGRVLGLFPTSRWPAADSRHEDALRRDLHAALVVGVQPSERTAAVISLLHAIRAVHKVVGEREDRKRVKARAKEISDGAWAAAAVRKAVDAVNAATMAAITAVVAAGSSGG